MLDEARSVLAVTHDLLAEDLGTHLLDGFGGEELEGLADSVGSNAMALEANLGHCVDALGRLVVEMLRSIEGLTDSPGGLADKELGYGLAWTGGSLGLGGDRLGSLHDLGFDANESRHCDWWRTRWGREGRTEWGCSSFQEERILGSLKAVMRRLVGMTWRVGFKGYTPTSYIPM